MTRGFVARPPKDTVPNLLPMLGGYPDNDPGPRPWNRCPGFNNLFRNKKSVTIDLRQPRGREMLERLIKECDIFYEEQRHRDYGEAEYQLRHAQVHPPRHHHGPRACLRQRQGPYRNYRALGVHLESVIGHSLIRGYRDSDPSTNSAIYMGDYAAGVQGAFAVMAALPLPEADRQGPVHRAVPSRERGVLPSRVGDGLHAQRSASGNSGEQESLRLGPVRRFPFKRRQLLDQHHRLHRLRMARLVRGYGQSRLVQGRTLLRPVLPLEERRPTRRGIGPMDCPARQVRGHSICFKAKVCLRALSCTPETHTRIPT